MFRFAWVLPLLAGATALAQPLGFSADGRSWVTRSSTGGGTGPVDEMSGEEQGPRWSVDYALVTELRTGQSQKYALAVKGDGKKAQAKAESMVKTWPDAAAFEAWKKEHPLTLALGRSSPDGKLKAEISVKPSDSAAWKKDSFEFERMAGGDGNCRSLLTFSVVREGKAEAVQSWWGEGPGAGMLSGAVQVAWAPDGRRVAWLIHRNSGMMRDHAEDLVRFSGVAGPRIELLAEKSISEAAAPRVLEALDAKGFTVTNVGPAKKAREATVVYAAKGFEEAAKAVAAIIPGGATVDALSWKTEAELVVAAGSSVLKK